MPQIIPAVVRVKLAPDCTLDARNAEHVVEYLYRQHQWDVLTRRFRIRGSELDLAMIHFPSRTGRIVEVKLRTCLPKINFGSTKDLLPTKKIAAIRRGAIALNHRISDKGLDLTWILDMALVVPDKAKTHCLIYTWQNAVEL